MKAKMLIYIYYNQPYCFIFWSGGEVGQILYRLKDRTYKANKLLLMYFFCKNYDVYIYGNNIG